MNLVETKTVDRTYNGIMMSSEFMDGASKVFTSGLSSLTSHINKLQSVLISLQASSTAKNSKYFGGAVKDRMTSLEVNNIFSKNYEDVSFINISSVVITVPSGLNTYMLPYGMSLKSVYDNTYLLLLEFMKYTVITLSHYVTNKNSRTSTSLNFNDVNIATTKRAEYLKTYTDFFDKKSDGGKNTIGGAFQNKQEILDSIVLAFELSKTIYKGTDFKLIGSLVQEVNDLSSLLEQSIKSESVEFTPSNQVIKLITETLYTGGSLLDLFGSLYYASEVYVETIDKVVLKLK